MTKVSERLQEAMRLQGVDQVQLAARIGVSQAAISNILTGATANSRHLPRIAVEMGLSLPWLVSGIVPDDGGINDGLTIEERGWLDLLRALAPDDRKAVLHLARTIATSAQVPTLQAKKADFRGAKG